VADAASAVSSDFVWSTCRNNAQDMPELNLGRLRPNTNSAKIQSRLLWIETKQAAKGSALPDIGRATATACLGLADATPAAAANEGAGR
jgi:hypothetical protein